MTLDIRKIQYFTALFEEGSTKRAAERHNIVQPAMSMQLKQLEAELSVRLFERSAQGIQPTPAGRHFYKLCLGLLRDLDATRQEMFDFGTRVKGGVRLGLMPSICRGPFAQILTRYTEDYPDVEIKVFEATSGALADMLLAGDLDFAVCNPPVAQTRLKLQPVFNAAVALVSGRSARWKNGVPCNLAKLSDLKLVLPSRSNSLRRKLDRQIKAGAIRASRIIEIDGLSGTMSFIESSGWSTLVPSVALVNDHDSDRFLINPVAAPVLVSEIVEMHSPDRPLSLPGQKMVAAIQEALLAEESVKTVPGIRTINLF
jgi:LysR family nitrogen assimilation transcriptional regulator